LASGALVQALPDTVLEDARIGWWFISPRGKANDTAQAFHAWLADAAASD